MEKKMLEIHSLDYSVLVWLSISLDAYDLSVSVYEKSVSENNLCIFFPCRLTSYWMAVDCAFDLELLLTERPCVTLLWIKQSLGWASFKHSEIEIWVDERKDFSFDC